MSNAHSREWLPMAAFSWCAANALWPAEVNMNTPEYVPFETSIKKSLFFYCNRRFHYGSLQN